MSKNSFANKDNINNAENQAVRVRFAPSPTGMLHVGTARTALFNFLFARHNKGKFYLRIEDTDTERSRPEFEKDIIENLRWLGLKWDGRILKQSHRRKIYAKHIKKLLDSGRAFWCYHSKEELEAEKHKQESGGEAQVHFCSYKNDAEFKTENQSQKTDGVIRLKCSREEKIKFNDLIRGEIEFDASQIGDMVIAKDEKTPLYNLAVVIDDYESKITHVIRGEDHISNTPKQIMILEALDFLRPEYAHIPLTLAPDRTKLSKRHGATAIQEYKDMGYLSEALNNFMAFLGWNPGNDREIFSLKELVKEFTLERMQNSAAIFNVEKLDWFNRHYIKKMPIGELAEKCVFYLEKENLIEKHDTKYLILNTKETVELNYLKDIVSLERERIRRLSEIGELTGFFFRGELAYDTELLRWKNMTNQELKTTLDKLHNILSNVEPADFAADKLSAILMPEAMKMGDRGRLLWPLRASITGLKASPGPFEVLAVLGKKRALKRVKEALMRLQPQRSNALLGV